MFRWILRSFLVTLDWLALFGVTVVLLLVVVAPLLSGLFGPSQSLGSIATVGAFFIAAVVATFVNESLRRTLFSLGRPGAADPRLLSAGGTDGRRRIQVRLAFLALALALLGVPLAAYLAGIDNRSSAGRLAPTPIARAPAPVSPSPSPAQGSTGTGEAGATTPPATRAVETPTVAAAAASAQTPTTVPTVDSTLVPSTPAPTAPATMMPTETPLPVPTEAPAPTVAAAPTDLPTPPASPLIADDFDNPAVGLLSNSSPLPTYYSLGYADGEYAIRKLIPGWAQSPGVSLPGRHGDTSIRVDARIVGETAQRLLIIACRDQGAQGIDSNYRLQVAPGEGTFSLARWDRGREAYLVGWTPSSAIRTGNQVNRLELVCVGSRIAALINSTQVASVADNSYAEGQILLLVSHRNTIQATVEGRFDNLLVTRP